MEKQKNIPKLRFPEFEWGVETNEIICSYFKFGFRCKRLGYLSARLSMFAGIIKIING